MADEPFKIEVARESVAERAKRRRSSGFRWWMGVALAGLLLAFGTFFWGTSSQPKRLAVPEPPNALPIDKPLSAASESPAEEMRRELAVDDDGQLLWVSPTEGSPLPLNYLPAATQLILHLQPRELLDHGEGEKVLAALGPWGKMAIARLAVSTGATLAEVRSLTASIYPDDDGNLQWCLRLELVERWDKSQLAERLPDSETRNQRGQSILEAADRACYLPTAADGKLLVSCPLTALDELLSQGDHKALFPRDMQRLLDLTDGDRMATLVFPNKFLQVSGKRMIRGAAVPLLTTCSELLRDDAAAIALSAHWDENFFLELQSTVNLDRRPQRFASEVAKRVSDFPDEMEDAVLAEPTHPYGRKVVGRFPNMLRKLSNYTRGDEVEGVTVLRSYLPLSAGHNLLMAAELALHDFALDGEAPIAAQVAPPTPTTEGLQQVTSLAFQKETLQTALEMLSEDIGVAIRIAGGDLQLEGITKNQSLGLDLRDRPAAEILLEVLLKANPDRTATGPDDPKQKLVYTINESADERGVVNVTTRSAAQKRGDKLPAVFKTNEK